MNTKSSTRKASRASRRSRFAIATLGGAAILLALPWTAAANVELGGVDLSKYCQSRGYDSAALVGPVNGPNAAYGWRCRSGSSYASLDVTVACREQHHNPTATARALNLNEAYSWRCFAPGTSALPTPAPSSASYEPNDSIAAAYGPLAGGLTYPAQLETQNDEDWFVFYTNGQQQFDVSFTNLTDGCTNLIMEFLDANGEEIDSVRPSFNETRHIQYTAPAAARYYLRVYDLISETCGYQLRVDPPGALTTQPPLVSPPTQASPPTRSGSRSVVSPACRQARSRVSSLSSRLRRAHGFRQRRKLRAQMRRARAQIGRSC